MPFHIKQIRFSVLLFLTILMILVVPFLRGFVRLNLLLDIFTSLILISAIWATGVRKFKATVAVCLALLYLSLTWSGYAVQTDLLAFARNLVGILLFGLVIYSIIGYIVSSEEVTREIIFAAIVSYLFIAIIWSFGYSALELVEPGSFKMPDEMNSSGESFSFFYFSFITITTLGYGDVTPLTAKAASLAVVEALIGQIYLVVLVAWLVGMYVSRKSR